MTTSHIQIGFSERKNRLHAHRVDWLYGRKSHTHIPDSPAIRGRVIGGCLVAMVCLAAARSGHFYDAPTHSATAEMLRRGPRSGVQSLPLLADFTALTVLASVVWTPFFCSEQVFAIRRYVRELVGNGLVQLSRDDKQIREFERCVEQSNLWYSRIGSWWYSGLSAIASVVFSVWILSIPRDDGIYRSWYFSLPQSEAGASGWARSVYEGWWANPQNSVAASILYHVAIAFMMYCLVKQLSMGFVFMVFTRTTHRAGMGILPNFAGNLDGYFGLRFVRRFMAANFWSTTASSILYVVVFFVFMPVNGYSILGLFAVVALSSLVVFYPTLQARHAVVRSKQRMAELVCAPEVATLAGHGATRLTTASAQDVLEAAGSRASLVQELWAAPNLPFRFRSAAVALAIYLVVPVFLAFLSGVLEP